MIDFIPLEYYHELYLNFTGFLVLIILFNSLVLPIDDSKIINTNKIIGITLLIFAIIYMGLRPINGYYFGDMSTYARHFDYYANGGEVYLEKDIFFNLYMKFTSSFLSVHAFFTLCAFLYIYPMYRVSKVFFKEYWYYAFYMLVVSFSFWAYGVNGIRNGIATSLFLLAISYHNKKMLMYIFFIVSYFCHQTLIVPVAAFLLASIYNKPKHYLLGWLACIPLSLVLGGFWENFFAGLGFADDRLSGYLLSDVDSDSFSRTGFRWDFVIYSSSGVIVGWYFIFKKKFTDLLYSKLYGTYLITNAFWILVIRANFSNRFAYLSWFLLALIIIYPYLKQRFYNNQHAIVGRIILSYFLFTFLMYYVYYA